ncbi:porin [Paraburkholderia phenoliruptrix]|uniref:Porin n=2 Tax=Paraburkholderia phenoliruptrix TaxID=252970 RepID=A0A6J5K749_9BURK|nr:porin [Paraburkholderia phenoliruptrix]MDR6389631.1 GBP family porin [Paraburkholderia phenoliruptrix]MDR6419839.1 GBP family porin [Paraburkholderia phenoliruptrix]WMY09020.1 porin [Paraburkholderia phenoliruptrix]CAB3674408.1 Outer membrane porin protein [Paraburkholderia phenoliruptrix]CAB4049152.1 Outer membrane porin protein [Paraburkholderia phenoliruptrix]
MKKTLMVAALSGVFATAAHAQSSVTLYGLIDAGITYTNNQHGHSNWQQTSGSVNGSRWGLRGAEDLGGGLKAIFTLENGFGINDGSLKQGGREFGRQAFVGLSSTQFGAVTLGRQYDSVVDFVGPLALTGTQYGGTQFAHPFDNDNLNNSFRVNNSVKYTSANYGGLKFGGMYGFSNQADGFANNRAYSAGASYNWGGLNVGAAYLQLNSNGATGAAAAFNSGGAVSSDNTFFARRQQTWGAGANYAFGPATVGLVYSQTNLTGLAGIGAGASGQTGGIAFGGGSAHFQNFEANARYALTPAVSIAGSYTYTRASLAGTRPHWNQFNLQTAYALSKRTDVYLQGEYQQVNENAIVGADINGLAASSNNKQVAVTAGLRHRF